MTSPFRERLVRELGGRRTLCVSMQNPSTAAALDPTINDPTVLRLIGFTGRLGFGRLVAVNTYDRTATDPADLYRWLWSLSASEREAHRQRALAIAIAEARAADLFIAAWGNGSPDDRWPLSFADGLVAAGIDLYHLGLNQNGTPKHPLARGKNRIPDNQVPALWRRGQAIADARKGMAGG
jgi:hypothetical protein